MVFVYKQSGEHIISISAEKSQTLKKKNRFSERKKNTLSTFLKIYISSSKTHICDNNLSYTIINVINVNIKLL